MREPVRPVRGRPPAAPGALRRSRLTRSAAILVALLGAVALATTVLAPSADHDPTTMSLRTADGRPTGARSGAHPGQAVPEVPSPPVAPPVEPAGDPAAPGDGGPQVSPPAAPPGPPVNPPTAPPDPPARRATPTSPSPEDTTPGTTAPRTTPSTTAPSRPAIPGSVQPPSSIDASGATDVSEAFGRFVHSVPDGSVISLPAGARYRMDQTLLLEHRRRLTFEGNGATFLTTASPVGTRANVRVIDGDDITFRNLHIVGSETRPGTTGTFILALEGQHGIDIRGTRNVTITGTTIRNTHGDFVHIGDAAQGWADGVVIRNNHFEGSGRQGIAFFAARNVTVENNTITNIRRATFDFEPGGARGVDNVTIRNNKIGKGGLNWVAAAGHGPVNNITIEDNTVTGQGLQVFLNNKTGGRRSNWKILNNTSDKTMNPLHDAVMRFWRVDGLQVVGNVQPFKSGGGNVGVLVEDSCDVVIRGNTFPHAVDEARVTQPSC